jgi:hypothetical protein
MVNEAVLPGPRYPIADIAGSGGRIADAAHIKVNRLVSGLPGFLAETRFDEAEFAEHGAHSHVERRSEESLCGLVEFLWHAVLEVAAAR